MNASLTPDVNPLLDAVRFFDPTSSMLKSPNVASPDPLVVCVVVPLSVPFPDDNVIVIVTPDVGTSLPKLSRN